MAFLNGGLTNWHGACAVGIRCKQLLLGNIKDEKP